MRGKGRGMGRDEEEEEEGDKTGRKERIEWQGRRKGKR